MLLIFPYVHACNIDRLGTRLLFFMTNYYNVFISALKDHLLEERDFFCIPEAAWFKLMGWYGITEDSRPIQRVVVEPGPYVKRNTVEVYPLKLKLCTHPPVEKLTTVPFSKGHTVGKPVYFHQRQKYDNYFLNRVS